MKMVLIVLAFSALSLSAQDMASCPMHAKHQQEREQHRSDVEKHGDEAMGFSHEKTTHHFRLLADGGAIQVVANNADDKDSLAQIRMHLAHIATMFKNGDFSAPMFVHSQDPPGANVMEERRDQITYAYLEMPTGGEVRIQTQDAEALQAIHDFLRFQIEDHHTGDKPEVD
ncbi:conserved hypothetical protein [Candidatus Koribacter versatilis Ellin345]|uniref:Aspartate carbamoyltransferase n=1 Tax=Koribacter versatilis (strain Ellin345) TaxID=204669 RepID=Q1IT11_KORVE|nr:hypothetical protein [Candidatus Koribacter versatilis]ABF39989.1 conserved hypothetical protein [Candidatus Koribacter versatilis Ellin345]